MVGLSVHIIFETILGPDWGKSFGKTNSKSYLKLGVTENQRNFENGNFRTVPKTLNNHKVRLNWAMKLNFSGKASLVKRNKW